MFMEYLFEISVAWGWGGSSGVHGPCTLGTGHYSGGVTRHDVRRPGLKIRGVKQEGGNLLPGHHTAAKFLSHCSLGRPSAPSLPSVIWSLSLRSLGCPCLSKMVRTPATALPVRGDARGSATPTSARSARALQL